MLEHSLKTLEKVYGADHPRTATVLINLGNLQYQRHAYREAIIAYERSLAIIEAKLGNGNLESAYALLAEFEAAGARDQSDEVRDWLSKK